MLLSTREAKAVKYGVAWEEVSLLGGSCHGCQEGFGWFQVRRHCRKCGFLHCSTCLHSERQAVSGSSNPKPVCSGCASAPGNRCASQKTAARRAARQGGCHAKGMCEMCGKSLGSGQVFVLGETEGTGELREIHLDCFRCAVDNQPIEGSFLEDEEGKLYCEGHYGELFCERCEGCSLPILDGVVTKALGGSWHAECFCCGMCSTVLQAPPELEDGAGSQARHFQFRVHNGTVACERCYSEKLCGRCSGCGFAVADGGISAMGQLWHEECLSCQSCHKPIASMDSVFFVYEGLPLCTEDAKALGAIDVMEQVTLPAATKPRKRCLSGQEKGRCLSHGIRGALLDIASSSNVRSSASSATSAQRKKSSATASLAVPQSWSMAMLPPAGYQKHSQFQFSIEGDDSAPIAFDFEAFAPEVFESLRAGAFGIAEEHYLASLADQPLQGGCVGEGKSGMLFFFSWDKRFIVKTVTEEEMPFFRKCLKDYHIHHSIDSIQGDSGETMSYLPKFLGLYTIKFCNEAPMHVVVMANVFVPGIPLKEQYDLKGVLGRGRFVDEQQLQQGVKVMKDRNFVQRPTTLRLEQPAREALAKQIRRDVKFLEERGRIDYSLLLGIAAVGDVHNPGHTRPSAESGGLQVLNEADQPGDEVVFMGIIDILQAYNMRKALEGGFKSMKHAVTHWKKASVFACADNAVSATSATHYGRRFTQFVVDYI